MPYTAFAKKKSQAITARLIIRRVRDPLDQLLAGSAGSSLEEIYLELTSSPQEGSR